MVFFNRNFNICGFSKAYERLGIQSQAAAAVVTMGTDMDKSFRDRLGRKCKCKWFQHRVQQNRTDVEASNDWYRFSGPLKSVFFLFQKCVKWPPKWLHDRNFLPLYEIEGGKGKSWSRFTEIVVSYGQYWIAISRTFFVTQTGIIMYVKSYNRVL